MSTGLTMEDVQIAANNRDKTLMDLDKTDCEESLLEFVKRFWSVVEPARPFVQGWAIDAIAEHLTAVTDGHIRKLLMNVPPGFMKSLMSDVFWPAWEWGPRNKPSTRYVCASYSEALTIRDNNRTRMILKSPDYQAMWGDRFGFDQTQDAKVKFANDRTGFKLATSVHGLGTGERGDRVIIDDPHNVLEAESDAKREQVLQWFTEVMPTRINDPEQATFIVIMQRVHEQDVAGLILSAELGYEHLCIPMHYDPNHPFAGRRRSFMGWRDPRRKEGELAFPERYTEAAVAEMEKSMMAWGGTYAVAGQLEQRPEPRGGGMVQRDWLEVVDRDPGGPLQSARAWDFASTDGGDGAGTASVLTVEEIDTGDIWIMDVEWERVSPGGLYSMIEATLTRDGWDTFQSFPLDPGQAGKYQADDLLDLLAGHDFEFTAETGEKEVRFRPFAAQAEVRAKIGRKIKVRKAKWNDVYFDHICKFPRGRYKDIPDAQGRSYGALVRRGSSAGSVPGGSTCVEGSN